MFTPGSAPIGRVSDASQRHVGAPSTRELLTSTIAAVPSNGGLSTGARTQEGLQRISEANLKHGRLTKDKLAAQRHAAKVGCRVMGELKRLECLLVDTGLMPDD